jgi:hypothetical protein
MLSLIEIFDLFQTWQLSILSWSIKTLNEEMLRKSRQMSSNVSTFLLTQQLRDVVRKSSGYYSHFINFPAERLREFAPKGKKKLPFCAKEKKFDRRDTK